MSGMSEPVVVRVGDRERTEVDALLRDALADGVLTLTEYDERAALCWAARTRPELDEVVRDLPAAQPPAGLPAVPGQPGAHRVLAVLSESGLEAPLRSGQDVQATAVMGTAEVDLRREDLPRELTVRATAVMGEVKVHVPPGTTVHLSGQAVMGERKAKLGPPVAGGSVVHVVAHAVMGTVKVDDAPRRGGLLPAVVEAVRTGSRQVAPAHPGPVAERRRRPGVLSRVAGALVPLGIASVLGFGGYQVVTSDQVAVFGSSEQTVQPADVEDARYEVGVVFGSVTVVVPEGVRARVDGMVVFGSSECGDACTATEGELLVVDVTGAFGSVEVVTEAEQLQDSG
jgi:hypothetical protein